MSRDDLDHHRVPVREDLDCAYRATATAAVRAHFKLAPAPDACRHTGAGRPPRRSCALRSARGRRSRSASR
jgi:hypothetical protein